MKTKTTAIILAAAILFSFSACSVYPGETTTSETSNIMETSDTTEATETSLSQTDLVTTSTSATTTRPTTTTTRPTTTTTRPTTTTTRPITTTTRPTTTAPTTAAVKTFTAAQLAAFNGQNGKASYLAYNGTVYDVTNVSRWSSGSHFGLVVGTDVTAQIRACNNHLATFIAAQFASYPVVGRYIG